MGLLPGGERQTAPQERLWQGGCLGGELPAQIPTCERLTTACWISDHLWAAETEVAICEEGNHRDTEAAQVQGLSATWGRTLSNLMPKHYQQGGAAYTCDGEDYQISLPRCWNRFFKKYKAKKREKKKKGSTRPAILVVTPSTQWPSWWMGRYTM